MSILDREKTISNSENKQTGSFNLAYSFRGSVSSSLRSHSLSFADEVDDDDDAESVSVSEAGDIGDRSFLSSRKSWSGRVLSIDELEESRTVIPKSDDAFHGAASLNDEKKALPPLSLTHSVAARNENLKPKENRSNKEANIWILEYISCLMALALFGDLGVITRYYLQKLFGPGVIGATSYHSYMYPDLPSNMVGSFLMGWLGVVFKGDISKISNILAIGLTTGYLGSLTTFSGWNQMSLELTVEGQWLFSIFCIVIGLLLSLISIIVGIDTAKIFQLLMRKKRGEKTKFLNHDCSWNMEGYPKSLLATLVWLSLFIVVWFTCIAFDVKEFRSSTNHAQLLLACIVGPFGVWIRWFLARWNGRGLGERSRLKWIPFGTLAANVLASSVMATLALLRKMVKTYECDVVAAGIQLGFCGCLSTVSTFMAEFEAMRQSNHHWRAYVYGLGTTVISFASGTLIYSTPVWIKGY